MVKIVSLALTIIEVLECSVTVFDNYLQKIVVQ